MANNTNNTSKFWASIVIGILAIGLSFYGVFFLHVKTSIQWIFIVLLLLTGIVSLSILWGGSIKIIDTAITATNAFALLVFLIVVIFKLFKPPTEETSLKIQVRQTDGTSVLNHEIQALKISLGKDTKIHDLDANSEVLLNAPANAEFMEAEILNDNWQFTKTHSKTTSLKIPQTEILVLNLEPAEDRCCVQGRVVYTDKKQHDLTGITVQTAGVSTKTDAQGNYRLTVPQKSRLENLSITAFTATHSVTILCNTASPCDLKLTKK